MIYRMSGKTFYYENGSIQKGIVGDLVITIWFGFDFMTNIFQIHLASYLNEYAYLIAADVSMRHLESVYTTQFSEYAKLHRTGSHLVQPCNVNCGNLGLELVCLDEDMWKTEGNGRLLWENFYGDLKQKWKKQEEHSH